MPHDSLFSALGRPGRSTASSAVLEDAGHSTSAAMTEPLSAAEPVSRTSRICAGRNTR